MPLGLMVQRFLLLSLLLSFLASIVTCLRRWGLFRHCFLALYDFAVYLMGIFHHHLIDRERVLERDKAKASGL